MTTPVWCTGAGRALLWDLDDASIEALLADVVFVGVGGPRAAHSSAEVLELVRRDRAAGHATAVEEFEQGFCELALPLLDAAEAVVASLSIVTDELSTAAHPVMMHELEAARRRIEPLLAG